jgi:hypothetical protein
MVIGKIMTAFGMKNKSHDFFFKVRDISVTNIA